MPFFAYIGSDERRYPDWPVPGSAPGLTATPGQEPAELGEVPGDGRWVPVESPQAKAKSAAKTGTPAASAGPVSKEASDG